MKQTDIQTITPKRYTCDRCGHESLQTTNHFGKTWSFGHFNTCPNCPPWAKYPEFGGSTTWTCIEASNPTRQATTTEQQKESKTDQ